MTKINGNVLLSFNYLLLQVDATLPRSDNRNLNSKRFFF